VPDATQRDVPGEPQPTAVTEFAAWEALTEPAPTPAPPEPLLARAIVQRPLIALLGGALILGLLVGGTTALATGGGDKAAASAGQVSTTTTTAPRHRAASTTTSTTAPPSTTAAVATTAAPPAGKVLTAAPSVDSLTASTPRCPGNRASDSVTLRWSTSNATAVTLSVDGQVHGSFGGGNGSTALSYACPGPHTYELVATSPGGTATKTLTVAA
jgi:hypothetical protein